MTDSATPASTPGSSKAEDTAAGNILERFQRFKVDHPNAAEYQLENELEAATVLTALAAMLRSLASEDIPNPADRATMRAVANRYQTAVVRGQCLNLFRKMTREDQVYLSGIKIVAPRRWQH